MARWIVLVGVLTAFPGGVVAQPGREAASVPRTAWGDPDLGGLWANSALTPLARPPEVADREFYSESDLRELNSGAAERWIEVIPAEERAVNPEFNAIWMEPGRLSRRTSLIVGPDGTVPPLTPEAEAQRAAGADRGLFDSFEDRPTGERCLHHGSTGPPMLAQPFANLVRIFQTPDHVALVHEESHELRIIPLDGRPHVHPMIRLWRGDSRGYWDEETLVVETRNFNEKGRFMGSGEALLLTERFRRVDDDTLLFAFTASDPATWTKPWTAEMPLNASPTPMFEYACHEGNYSLPLILRGARVQERETATAEGAPK